MSVPPYFPYRSAAARDSYFAHYDSLAAKVWPVASEERMVPTSYGDTFVRITGPAGAPPLVLLPGGVASSLMWAPNVQALSRSFRNFAVDQIGDIGRTTCMKPVRSLNDLLAWLDEFLDALDLRSGINLAGCSYGGWLAAEYARCAPERLAKVIMIAPGGTILRIRSWFIIRLMLGGMAERWCLRPVMRWIFADQVRIHPEWLEPFLDQMRMSMHCLAPRNLPMPKVWTHAEWSALSVPALFLDGEHEVIYDPVKAVRRLRRVAPQVASDIIRGAGHDLTLAQAEIVNQKVLEFLRQGAAAPALSAATYK